MCLIGEASSGKSALLREFTHSQMQRYTTSWLSTTRTCLHRRSSLGNFQAGLEDCLEKRRRDVFSPVGNKKLICFIDDLTLSDRDVDSHGLNAAPKL